MRERVRWVAIRCVTIRRVAIRRVAMRRVAIRRVAIASLVPALVLGARPACATSMRPGEPLLEKLAHGEPLPADILLWTADRKRYARRAFTEREAVLLRRLGPAQAADDARPFQEALGSRLPVVVEHALEGLAFGRVANGDESGLRPLPAARAQDAAFVAGFLPTLARLAKEPVDPDERTTFSTVPERAALCLALLARGTRSPEVRRRALDALVAGIAERRLEGALDALGYHLLYDDPVPLAAEHRAALAPVVEGFLVEGFLPPGPIFIGYVLGALAPADADRLYERAKAIGQRERVIEGLLHAGHVKAIEDMRALAHSRPTGREADVLAHFDRVADRISQPELAPVLEERLARLPSFEREAAKTLVGALESLGAKAAVLRQLERDLTRPEGHLAVTAEAAARMDPPTAARLRSMLPTLPDARRAVLVRALIRGGVDGLERGAAMLAQRGSDDDARWWAILALGDQVRRTRSRTALAALERLWSEEQAQPTAEAILGAVREGGWLPPETERLIIVSLRSLPREETRVREEIAKTLGALGGAESESALRPYCAYDPSDPRRNAHELRVACRAAVGAIEARTGR